jgi:lysylphosphatidylglycerol synthetase-like protein (DUF2156 family)
MILGLIFFLVFIGLGIAFLTTLSNLLLEIRPHNRRTEPKSVWLMLIPLFNLVYAFFFYKKLCDSIRAEYNSRGLVENTDGSYILGAIGAACMLINTIINFLSDETSLLSGLISLVGMIFWIIFWIRMAGYRKKISALPLDQDSEIFGHVNRS